VLDASVRANILRIFLLATDSGNAAALAELDAIFEGLRADGIDASGRLNRMKEGVDQVLSTPAVECIVCCNPIEDADVRFPSCCVSGILCSRCIPRLPSHQCPFCRTRLASVMLPPTTRPPLPPPTLPPTPPAPPMRPPQMPILLLLRQARDTNHYSPIFVPTVHAILGTPDAETGAYGPYIRAWANHDGRWMALVLEFRNAFAADPALAVWLQPGAIAAVNDRYAGTADALPYVPRDSLTVEAADPMAQRWPLPHPALGVTQEGILSQLPFLFLRLQALIGEWLSALQPLPMVVTVQRQGRGRARAQPIQRGRALPSPQMLNLPPPLPAEAFLNAPFDRVYHTLSQTIDTGALHFVFERDHSTHQGASARHVIDYTPFTNREQPRYHDLALEALEALGDGPFAHGAHLVGDVASEMVRQHPELRQRYAYSEDLPVSHVVSNLNTMHRTSNGGPPPMQYRNLFFDRVSEGVVVRLVRE